MANRNTRHVEINFDASMDIQDIRSALKTIQDGFDGLNLPENISKKLVKDLSKLKDELDNFEGLSGGMQNLEDIGKAERSLKKILELYSKLNIETKELSSIEIKNLLPDNIKANINSATKAFDSYKKSIKEIETQAAVTGKRLEELRILKEEATKIKTTRTKAANALRTFEEEDTRNNTRSKLSSELEAARLSKSNFKKTHKEETDYLSEDFLKIEARIKAAEKALRDYDSTYKTLQDTYSDADKALTKNLKSQENYNDLQKEYGESLKKIKEALTSLGEQEKNQAFDSLKKQLSEIEGFDVDNLKADLSNFNSLVENLSDAALKDLRRSLDLVDNGLDQTGQAASRASNNLDKIEESAESIAKTSDEIANLKNRILDFFSIGNAVQIFQNSIERAFQSVKELDAAMTETAVVTDFSVGDMWEALPQYSSIARELGTTTLDVYEATTLLYQQGLQTNEVMEAGTEILKFARIAGLDAADATNFMTAAIRGFNMEMNEVNTKRVNDVYSELAAITASDTEQISIAVSKTASLAKNAGMELETTAAMLAQVIETTQEAPETAGTALKTIIARFQELKKDPLEMEEIDGEVVDANKIEAALRSVGVALRDTTGQFRDLDDVFLELSSKWNTLDKNQQRYIATVAAGSRLNANRLQLAA